MFRFITKKEYWAIEDSRLTAQLAPSKWLWHLKNIQDAVAYKYLSSFKGKVIAEVGGGESRVLPALANCNSCYNIEPFEGMGNGPKTNSLPLNIVNVKALLGQTDLIIQDGAFDALFSISVVEHVPSGTALEAFFADSRRILKADDGFALHLIDIYTSENPSPYAIERCSLMADLFFQYFQPLPGEVMGRDCVCGGGGYNWAAALRFRSHYASNPDNVMNSWNKLAPSLRKTREEEQSCTLILAGYVKGAKETPFISGPALP